MAADQSERRPLPVVRGFKTTCPATHSQCERFPVICAEAGCQDWEFRHLPRPTTSCGEEQ